MSAIGLQNIFSEELFMQTPKCKLRAKFDFCVMSPEAGFAWLSLEVATSIKCLVVIKVTHKYKSASTSD